MLRGWRCRVPSLRAASWRTRSVHETAHGSAARTAAYRDVARTPAGRSLLLRLYRRRRAALAAGEALPGAWQRAGLFALFADGAWPECARALREVLRDRREDDGDAVAMGIRALLRAGATHRARDLVAWARHHRPAWFANPDFVDAAAEALLKTSAHQDLLPALEQLLGQGSDRAIALSAGTVDALLTRGRTDLSVAETRSLFNSFRSVTGNDAAGTSGVLARHVDGAGQAGDPLWFTRVRLLAFARHIGAIGDNVVGASLHAVAAAVVRGQADPTDGADAARRALRELRRSGAAASAPALEQGLDELAAALQVSAWDWSCEEGRRLARELYRLGPVAGAQQDVDSLDAAVTRLTGPGRRTQAAQREPASQQSHPHASRLHLAKEAWHASMLGAGPDPAPQRFHEALLPVLAAVSEGGAGGDDATSVRLALRACPSVVAAQQLANQMLQSGTDLRFAFPRSSSAAWREGALHWLAAPGTGDWGSAAEFPAVAVDDLVEALGLLVREPGEAQGRNAALDADDPMLALATAKARRVTMDRLAAQLTADARRTSGPVGKADRALGASHLPLVSRACVTAHRDGFDASILALAKASATHGLVLNGAALYAAVAAAERAEDVSAASLLLASSLRRGQVPHANALAAFLRTAAREWPPGSLHTLAQATQAWADTSAGAATSRRSTLRRAAALVEAPPAPSGDMSPFARVAAQLGPRLHDPHARTVHRALLQTAACCGAAEAVSAAVAGLDRAHPARDAALDAVVAGFEDRAATVGSSQGASHGAQQRLPSCPLALLTPPHLPLAQWSTPGARGMRRCSSCWARLRACRCGPRQTFSRQRRASTARSGPSAAGVAWRRP